MSDNRNSKLIHSEVKQTRAESVKLEVIDVGRSGSYTGSGQGERNDSRTDSLGQFMRFSG